MDVNQIYNSRKILLNYLKKQNYDTEKYENFTISEISAMEQTSKQENAGALLNQLNFELKTSTVDKETGKLRSCFVVYYIEKSMKKTVLQELIDEYYDDDDKDNSLCSLIIVTTNVNETNLNIVKEMWEKYGHYCVLYDLASLQYNIFEHAYVPKHIKLTNKEKESIRNKYNIVNDSQFPEISMFDPVSKALLLRPGELCEIIRYEKISYENKYYRICVN
jgi:DNA-directed RNA polymerase subunit H (RpoH/RPB5)|tara:strand:- start:15 stop:674 length:660 start_codon:yes stop_codon:yes gene_type:complete